MRVQPNRSRTYFDRAVAKINAAWPGGVDAMLRDYASESTDLAVVTRETGVSFRALRRIFEHHGVPIRSCGAALKLTWDRSPERREQARCIANTVLRREDVDKKSRAARRQAHLADPSKHINAKARMSKHEGATAAALRDAGIRYEFNKPFPPFWLDFWLPDLAVGIEVQRGMIPSLERDAHIRAAGARCVFYFQTYQIKLGRLNDLIEVILHVQGGHLDPASLGEYTMVSRRPHNGAYLQIGPHKFRWAFGPMYAFNCPPPPPVGKDFIAFPRMVNPDGPAGG